MISSINPANNRIIASYEEMSPSQIASILQESHKEFLNWKNVSLSDRAVKMLKAASVLRQKKNEFAAIITLEMGKPLVQAKAEVEKCALVCKYFAENAERFLADIPVKTDYSKSYVTFNPLGVIFAIMPWNFPFWQVFRFAAPTLMAGNAAVLKHSSNVTGCALAIEQVFAEAGFPKSLFRTLIVSSKKVGNIISNDFIKAVSLTGSVPAGKAVAAAAGKALKKSVLELGGSDPYIILNDADLEKTVENCVTARLLNGGQSCIAAKRFIIEEEIYEQFENLFVEMMSAQKMGDPFNENNKIGPQARVDLRDELHEQVVKSIEKGAKLLLGGEIPAGAGAYYPPTVLSNVKPGMPAYDEELFGPVAALIRVKDVEEAVKIANDSPFGLGGAVFTADVKKGEDIARNKIFTGTCCVNDFVKSDPRLPFGGINESGYGRELSEFGIKEFVNIKTVVVK
ncbi:MAG: NAD-dependent succinate-semialdehyde dehydrogenase [Bacteroidota bacterium]|nr:NAD-dependent succinate-semialdehyde dehydrogenase [Bacteroidota bacterium]